MGLTNTLTHTRCRHCGAPITHGGTSALTESDLWFTADDDFLCPDGEHMHSPVEEPDFAEAKHILRVNRCGDPVGFYAMRERISGEPCKAGCLAPGSSPHYHLSIIGWTLIGTEGLVEMDADMSTATRAKIINKWSQT
jgi:hypothetical protein